MTTRSPSSRAGLPLVVVVLLVLNILPELILQASDRGYLEGIIEGPLGLPGLLRNIVYFVGSFQPELVTDKGELYPGHTLLMFLTYSLLHTGPFHLAINMVGLVWLGSMVLERRRAETFVSLYILSAIGAAEAFVLIGPEGGQMVGASGALFGLLGAYLVDSGLMMPRHTANPPLPARVLRVCLIAVALVICDLGSRALLGTPVAWEAHAGGFLTGAFMALAAPARLPLSR